MTLLVSCLPFVIWQKHVTDNFPNASSAKHAVSMSELDQGIDWKSVRRPTKIITLFVKSVFTFDSLARQWNFDNQSDYADCLYCDWYSFEI